MLLSKKTSIKVSQEYANVIGHMCYAASKLRNVCNYERQHYKEMGMEKYPDWYYQKKSHREDLWYKQLPSQTAQEVCKLLDKAWKSFYALKRSGGIDNTSPGISPFPFLCNADVRNYRHSRAWMPHNTYVR